MDPRTISAILKFPTALLVIALALSGCDSGTPGAPVSTNHAQIEGATNGSHVKTKRVRNKGEKVLKMERQVVRFAERAGLGDHALHTDQATTHLIDGEWVVTIPLTMPQSVEVEKGITVRRYLTARVKKNDSITRPSVIEVVSTSSDVGDPDLFNASAIWAGNEGDYSVEYGLNEYRRLRDDERGKDLRYTYVPEEGRGAVQPLQRSDLTASNATPTQRSSSGSSGWTCLVRDTFVDGVHVSREVISCSGPCDPDIAFTCGGSGGGGGADGPEPPEAPTVSLHASSFLGWSVVGYDDGRDGTGFDPGSGEGWVYFDVQAGGRSEVVWSWYEIPIIKDATVEADILSRGATLWASGKISGTNTAVVNHHYTYAHAIGTAATHTLYTRHAGRAGLTPGTAQWITRNLTKQASF